MMLATPESTVLLVIGAVVPTPYHKGLTVRRMIGDLMIYELLLVLVVAFTRDRLSRHHHVSDRGSPGSTSAQSFLHHARPKTRVPVRGSKFKGNLKRNQE